jgi:phage-related protein
MALNDYEYKFKTDGLVLNGSVYPFWDVDEVDGIVDTPGYGPIYQDLDGMHGAVISASFFDYRAINMKGTLYADANQIDIVNEAMRTTLLPDGIEYPLFFKHPGLVERYISCKPIDYRADVTTGRRNGQMPFQMQWAAEDPRHYADRTVLSFVSGTVAPTVVNAGNTDSFPAIKWTVTSAGTKSIIVATPNGSVAFSLLVAINDVITVDLRKRLIRKNSVFIPVSIVVTTDWPKARVGNNTFTVTTNCGNGTISPRDAWL